MEPAKGTVEISCNTRDGQGYAQSMKQSWITVCYLLSKVITIKLYSSVLIPSFHTAPVTKERPFS